MMKEGSRCRHLNYGHLIILDICKSNNITLEQSLRQSKLTIISYTLSLLILFDAHIRLLSQNCQLDLETYTTMRAAKWGPLVEKSVISNFAIHKRYFAIPLYSARHEHANNSRHDCVGGLSSRSHCNQFIQCSQSHSSSSIRSRRQGAFGLMNKEIAEGRIM